MSSHGPPFITGHGHLHQGSTAATITIPLLSGVDINPNLFAKKHKQEHPSHGSMTCS